MHGPHGIENKWFEKGASPAQVRRMRVTSGKMLRPVRLDFEPIEIAARCRHLPGFVFFDTALATANTPSAISMIAAMPRRVVHGRDWNRLRDIIEAEQRSGSNIDDGLPRGFAAGYISYDGIHCFGLYDDALIFRHADQSWHELGDFRAGLPETPRTHPGERSRPRFRAAMTRAEFCAQVQRAQEYIAAGDIYQVNLAHRFCSSWHGDPFSFYEALRHYSPAPFAAMLQLGGRTILSTSPESFLRISGRSIRTRPIKGTRPRRISPQADEKSAYDLLTSPKEIAELVMITDLERNDLGQVCEYGSVVVEELLALERFEQVFHLVSTVRGELRKEVDHVSALRACFPGGSITGAPKKRAREIIAELEREPRGIYTGAIGWFGFNGESQFNIAIRTVVIEPDRQAHFHVGAGIVADSVPEMEWQETLDKAAGILLAAERM
jgi:aminodeoxychorismate synthase component I